MGRSVLWLATVFLGTLLTFVCPSSTNAGPPAAEKDAAVGIVFIVEGVGGFDVLGPTAQRVLPRAGVPHEIRDFVWSHGWGHVLKDLQDAPYLKEKADQLAAEILRVRQADALCPIYLVGKSGGTGLVLEAAGQLPAGTVERIILLSAAVSPTYDLRPAFRATRSEIVSFYSRHDKVVLGWGTSQFGTVDRFYGPGAGLIGFIKPSNLTPEDQKLYTRLVEVPWNAHMILEGHLGTHLGTSLPAFVGKEIAPWLKP